MGWSTKNIPSQEGRLALVTGATGGLGLEAALALAGAGAEVVLTGRNAEKGAAALERIQAEVPGARVRYEQLDLTRLADISAFARRFSAGRDRLDILINNAGIMATPRRQETADGFELQFGTNYLGHFALTAHLLPLLSRTGTSHVVQVSSLYARKGSIALNDLNAMKRYNPYTAYAQSKLANLMFALELQRRAERSGWRLISTAAHPGLSHTGLFKTSGLLGLLAPVIGQSAAQGALPLLYAATSPAARRSGYYGPSQRFELVGPPAEAKIPAQALDARVAAQLWEASQQMTGVRFEALMTA